MLLVASIAFYVLFALDLFKKDKSAYIYETGLAVAESVSTQVLDYLENTNKTMLLMDDVFQDRNVGGHSVAVLEKIFHSDKKIIEYSIYKKPSATGVKWSSSVTLLNRDLLREYDLADDYFISFNKAHGIDISSIGFNYVIVNFSERSQIPHILMMIKSKKSGNVISARIKTSGLLQILKENKIYDSILLKNSGSSFLGTAASSDSFEVTENYWSEITQSGVDVGAREFTKLSGDKFLVAFRKIEKFGLFVLSEIKEETAFKASEYLMNKSIYFGMFVISISVLIGILFSRSLTSSLEKLFSATKSIAKGEFDFRVKIKARDEIGALSDSFNFMSQEIVRYMAEMTEKARLENEVAVAQLVQSSFFPDNEIAGSKLKLAAFHSSASECGGDWWGQIENGDKMIIFLADATGHGVPAALLTATAHCCFSNIKEMAKFDPGLIESPARIMELMNKAVCSVGSEIMMTAFIGLIDLGQKRLIYSNASQNPPFLYESSDQAPSKQSFRPLIEVNGPRLGENSTTTFDQGEIAIKEKDVVVLYTDGIIECKNVEGKEWGKRNFLKSMIKSIQHPAVTTRDAIIGDAQEFYKEIQPDDDITLVVAQLG